MTRPKDDYEAVLDQAYPNRCTICQQPIGGGYHVTKVEGTSITVELPCNCTEGELQ